MECLRNPVENCRRPVAVRCPQSAANASGPGENHPGVQYVAQQVTQGLPADAQSFTLLQTLRAIEKQGTLPALESLFATDCVTLSFQEGIRKPTKALYQNNLVRFQEMGIAPQEILHIGTRIINN